MDETLAAIHPSTKNVLLENSFRHNPDTRFIQQNGCGKSSRKDLEKEIEALQRELHRGTDAAELTVRSGSRGNR